MLKTLKQSLDSVESYNYAIQISKYSNPIYLFLPALYLIGVTLSRNQKHFFLIAVLGSFILVFIPLILSKYLLKHGKISNLYFSDKEERRKFFFPLMIACFIITIVIFHFSHAPLLVEALLEAGALNLFITSLFVKRFKLSLHCAGLSAIIAGFTIAWNIGFTLLLFLLVPVAWARVRLNQHTLLEVVLGSIGGFFATVALAKIILWLYS